MRRASLNQLRRQRFGRVAWLTSVKSSYDITFRFKAVWTLLQSKIKNRMAWRMKVGWDFGKQKGTRPPYKLTELKADLDRGMADVTEGRVTEFDARSIIALGRKLSAERAKAGSRKRQ